jgi:hypothetical protein
MLFASHAHVPQQPLVGRSMVSQSIQSRALADTAWTRCSNRGGETRAGVSFKDECPIATDAVNWWEGGAGAMAAALLGALIGGCIPLFWSWRLRRTERRGELVGMVAELHQTSLDCNSLRTEGIQAPLYRLPLSIFKQALPKLIGEGKLTWEEVSVLVEYVNRIDELNRGLDRAGAAHAAVAGVLLAEEFGRNCLKAEMIFETTLKRHGDQTLFDGAVSAVLDLQDAEDRWRWDLARLYLLRQN